MGKIIGIVNAASGPREHQGVMQIGFTLQEDPNRWYNIPGEESALEEIKKANFGKGNEVEFKFDNGKITDLKMIKKAEGGDDDMVNFEKLLNAGHAKAKKENVYLNMKSDIVRDQDGKPLLDLEKRFALFKSQVIITDAAGLQLHIFEGHGDTQESNIDGDTAKHWIRIAETRAKVRALRWYTNNAQCSEEEKGGDQEAPQE